MSGLSDWTDLLVALDAAEIKYLIVGGVAVGFHGEPRYTKDLDVFVAVDPANNQILFDTLKEFGAPVSIMTADEFLQEDFIFYFGSPPWRIDILTSIPGVNFADAYKDRVDLPLGNYKATCISKEWLIKAKQASGRPQDLLDLEGLKD